MASKLHPVNWSAGVAATFTATVPTEARELMRGMIPLHTSRGVLTAWPQTAAHPAQHRDRQGRYGLFTATTGEYRATYAADTRALVLIHHAGERTSIQYDHRHHRHLRRAARPAGPSPQPRSS